MQHPDVKVVDLLTPSVFDATNNIPRLDQGYKLTLAPGNRVVAYHATLPLLYLDESRMQWCVLDRHISEVRDARKEG